MGYLELILLTVCRILAVRLSRLLLAMAEDESLSNGRGGAGKSLPLLLISLTKADCNKQALEEDADIEDAEDPDGMVAAFWFPNRTRARGCFRRAG